MFEFDGAKDASNVKKHGISLARANDFDFSTASSSVDNSQDYGEIRYQAVGFIGATLHVLIYTIRTDALRASAFAVRRSRKRDSMPKSSKYGVPDAENPEIKKGSIARGLRLKDFPPEVQALMTERRGRGPQKSPTKKLVSLRLSPDVLAALRAKGPGWQTVVDETLREKFVA